LDTDSDDLAGLAARASALDSPAPSPETRPNGKPEGGEQRSLPVQFTDLF